MPRHAIVTCCDARYSGFLLDHWLVSLQRNVDLTDVDVVVLDYGLTDEQRGALAERGVLTFSCARDGVVCNVRYRDICRLLDEHPYDQILSVDGGDVIFQADIRPLFDEDPDSFRAAPEERQIAYFHTLADQADLPAARFEEILASLEGRPLVNAGFLIGPARKYRTFWEEYRREASSFDRFGMDQMLLNHVLYRDGFVALDRRYNFVVHTALSPYTIEEGVFLDDERVPIPVVHNAGQSDRTRAIRDFGYGADRNRRRWLARLRIRLMAWQGRHRNG